jgi:Sulfotransferase domain
MNDSEPREGARPSRRDASSRPSPRGNLGRARDEGSLARKTVATAMREPARAGAMRDGVDVICAGMYRACSTWQYEVVAHLLEHHRAGRRLGYLTPEEYVRTGRADGRDDGTKVPAEPGWNVFKSHDADRCFDRAIGAGRAVVVYAYRDVRDVVFSLMHKRSLTFEQLLHQGMIHQVLENDRFWTRQPGVLIQRYDAVLLDPVGAVAQLARYLGIEIVADEAERIAHEYSLESNKARTEALRRRLEKEGVDLKESANSLICDPATLLHWNHVRDGGSGSWYVESTPRQRVILEKLCGRWLESHAYASRPQGTAPDADGPLRLTPGQRLRLELDIVAGWMSYRARATSQRFPRLAATVKRWLGIADSSRTGATVWSERKTGA